MHVFLPSLVPIGVKLKLRLSLRYPLKRARDAIHIARGVSEIEMEKKGVWERAKMRNLPTEVGKTSGEGRDGKNGGRKRAEVERTRVYFKSVGSAPGLPGDDDARAKEA